MTLSSAELSSLSRDVLSAAVLIRLQAPGNSMRPTIRHNDIILVETLETVVRLGDIVLFLSAASRLTAHRVVMVDEQRGYLMRGDANQACDGWIGSEQILGRVVAIQRGRKTIAVNRVPFPIYRFYLSAFRCLKRLSNSRFSR